MSELKPNCNLRTGRVEQSLSAWLAAQTHAQESVLVACEPANARSLRREVSGLFVPAQHPSWSSWPLAEVWLYFPVGRLHALADGDAVQWAAWYEGRTDAEPAWCPEGRQRDSVPLARSRRTLVLQEKTSHRGLREAELNVRNVTVYEYHEQSALRWWRLDLDGSTR